MKGLELARSYYEEFGKAAIHENLPELENIIAVGLAGSGSECYGFDDEVSSDHDFEPGFCIWIPEEDEVDSRTAFRLERVYAKLPKEYMGFKKSLMQPAGGSRHGVIRLSEFLERHIGRKDAELTLADWFRIPECSLSEVINGEVWKDEAGRVSSIREKIRNMPEDVRLKKLAGALYLMGQSGSYNYSRCIAHGESGAAQLSLAEFAKNTMHAAFLLNWEYMPYYKWSFRAMRNLGLLSELAPKLEYLLTTDNSPANVADKQIAVEECNIAVIDTLKALELTTQGCTDLGNHADSVNNMIKDSYIRNMDILAGVQ